MQALVAVNVCEKLRGYNSRPATKRVGPPCAWRPPWVGAWCAEGIAEQQGVKYQRQDGVLGDSRCSNDSRGHAWSSTSLHAESSGLLLKNKLYMCLRVPIFCTGYRSNFHITKNDLLYSQYLYWNPAINTHSVTCRVPTLLNLVL